MSGIFGQDDADVARREEERLTGTMSNIEKSQPERVVVQVAPKAQNTSSVTVYLVTSTGKRLDEKRVTTRDGRIPIESLKHAWNLNTAIWQDMDMEIGTFPDGYSDTSFEGFPFVNILANQ
eukprot:TRINITY_DN2162_c0_g1_i3.p1 TRINITY_DN2162_c0_g1~~TRINITY_DN2162_c0_g1_i3.p1  ORF type:complete len:121 (+),score=34.66 TRINITY_DN2162_c0_g1_i3:141-503(+)